MAFTILDSPDGYSPAYNPCHYLVDSTNKGKSGFQYTCDLFTGSSFVPIARLKVPKRPLNGYGLIDVSSVLRPYIDHERDIVPNAGGFIPAPNYYKRYSIQWGEMSNYWSFSDSLFGSGGLVMFSSYTGDRHNFEVGDEIIVQQTAPFLYDAFNGFHTVLSVVDAYAFTIDAAFSSGPVTGGKVYRQDGGPIIQTGITSGQSVVVGYAFERSVFTDFTSDNYVASATNGDINLITNCPSRFRIRTDSQAWIPVINNTNTDYLRIITVGADANTVGVYEVASSILSNEAEFAYCGVGPANLTGSSYSTLSGPTTIFNASAVSYYVAFLSGSSAQAKTEQMRFDLDDRCKPFDSFKLLFCDKLGSWFPFDFYYKNSEEHTVKKQTYSKGGFAEVIGSSVVYKDQNRGFDPYNTEHIISYTVRTDWLKQEEADYLVELMMSPRAFWCQSVSKFIPVVLDDISIERLQEEQEDDKWLRYEVTFTKAFKEPSIN